MQEMIFQAPQGYPMPERLCYNAADLRLLTELYSGRESELSATMQYSYQKTFCINANQKSQKQSKKSA